jgi:hypothetical protein
VSVDRAALRADAEVRNWISPDRVLVLLEEADADRAEVKALRLSKGPALFDEMMTAVLARAEAAEAARDAAVADAANLRATLDRVTALVDDPQTIGWIERDGDPAFIAVKAVRDALGGQR